MQNDAMFRILIHPKRTRVVLFCLFSVKKKYLLLLAVVAGAAPNDVK